ncbi:MAG: hypothetical protein WCK35_18765 [Chloroflexota bacterium]
MTPTRNSSALLLVWHAQRSRLGTDCHVAESTLLAMTTTRISSALPMV